MKRMDHYIGKTVLTTTALTWLLVTVLEALFSYLGELADIGRGDYSLAKAGLFILLTLPSQAYQSFPMAVLIGALLGLGQLAQQAEIDAFRLAGCSPMRLARSLLQAGLVMLVLVTVIGEGIAPAGQQVARQIRSVAISDALGTQQDFGFWLRDGQRFIRVGQSNFAGHLGDISIFEMDATPRLVSTTQVSQAYYKQGQWRVQGVQETSLRDQDIVIHTQASAVWPHLVQPQLVQLFARDPLSLSLPELWQYIAYLKAGGSRVESYQLSYWKRWAAPATTLAMLVLALGLALGPLGRRSVGQRVLFGVLIGLGFKLMNEIIAHAGLVYGLSPHINAFLPTLLIVGVGTWLLRRSSV